MNILEEVTFKDKKYICMQKLIIDSKIIHICKEINSNKKIYLRENSKGNLEENDDNIKSKIDKLIYAKSEDVI